MTAGPQLFLPGREPDGVDAEIARLAGGDRRKLVYSIKYRADGGLFEVTVGERRRERRITRQTRGRGDQTRRVGLIGPAVETGGTVYAIVHDRLLTYIYETVSDQPSPWPNPALVGTAGVENVVPFAG